MKTIRLFIYISILALSIIISSCCENTKGTSVGVSGSIPLWKENNQLTYTSNNGDSKTFKVTYSDYGYIVKDMDNWCDTKETTTYYNVVMNPVDSINLSEPYCMIKTIGDQGYTLKLEGSMLPEVEADRYQHKTIAAKEYSDVYKFIDIDETIDSVFFSGKYGFLQYYYNTGEIWTLNNTIYDEDNN